MSPETVVQVPAPAALEVRNENGWVPAVYWQPQCAPRGIVLACHGGSGHKTSAAILAAVVRLMPLGISVLAIDGPVHGERSEGSLDPVEARHRFHQAWIAGTSNASMARDMRSALDALLQVPGHSRCPVGYLGVSMGTAYGLPLLATEPRIQAAAIGLWSARAEASSHLLSAALEVRCATWFTQQWNDEFFDREGTFELFDAIGAADKRLVIYPGLHLELQNERLDDAVAFLAPRLLHHSGSSSLLN